jgi:hypothetical protein
MAINNRDFYGPTMNAFYNMKTAADDKSQNDRGFNAEVLYSAGALDLRAEPMVLSLPKMGDRFFVFPVQDAWGNIDNVIGTRTEGNLPDQRAGLDGRSPDRHETLPHSYEYRFSTGTHDGQKP